MGSGRGKGEGYCREERNGQEKEGEGGRECPPTDASVASRSAPPEAAATAAAPDTRASASS